MRAYSARVIKLIEDITAGPEGERNGESKKRVATLLGDHPGRSCTIVGNGGHKFPHTHSHTHAERFSMAFLFAPVIRF